MEAQFVDLGVSRAALEDYLVSVGFWDSVEKRTRYGYVLSPCAYVVSRAQQDALRRLAHVCHRAVQSLHTTLCNHARSTHLTHEEARFLRLGTRSTRGLLAPAAADPCATPPVLKIDLVQNPEGHYRVAEVDAYNPRGLGYVALLSGTPGLTGNRYPGMGLLASLIKARTGMLAILISEFERYYEGSYSVLRQALQEYGVSTRMVREQDLVCQPERLFEHPDEQLLSIPESLDTYPQVRADLVRRYICGKVPTLYPPAAYLGSKAFLPFLSAEPGMDEFVPHTALLSKKDPGLPYANGHTRPTVLKAVMSSGMKAVYFSDLHPEYAQKEQAARSIKHPAWVVQEQVPQIAHPVTVFDEAGKRMVRPYYLRVIAHVTADEVLDVEITGRPDRLVHGAPDCIQLPSLLA